ncbi:6-O-methylguanine DNA methyltransferase-like protein [Kitasatospora sp. SolWspMP-SS2h]|uniref:Ada metal-binding domain-containing protein n=1 Tax=Kitasatospora sp. SolWspMP-SS2h TaxID=1305729 RepID=UPI000DC050F4|nr:Ada metal-binding domain-containing protein [Kitasatospora sp. SolWspMP-SS2h]RAJ38342.1 6-O-methylguanine DNA methyltransferase-like protein [Kitasatospora sp. SolWspMP-SS2h]
MTGHGAAVPDGAPGRAANGAARPGAGGTPIADARTALGLDALRVPMPADLALRILERAGVPEREYDRYALVEGPVTGLFVAYGRGAVTGAAPVDWYPDPAAFEEAYLRRTGRSVLRTGKPLPGVVGALRTGRDRMLRYDHGTLTEAQWRVLEAVRAIPRGQLRPTGWVAREAGLPGADQGELLAAVRANPVPVLIPVHRLADEDGTPLDCGLPAELAERLRTHEGIDEERLDRFLAAGTHFLGSDTTRIFCYPTCAHARRITDRHRVPFGTADAAHAAGYRACLSCRPVAA